MSAVSALRAAKATGSRLGLLCGVLVTLVALAGPALRASVAEAADIPRFSAPLVTIQRFAGSELAPIVAADFNGDGKSDVAIAGKGGATVDVRLGKGDGSFRKPASYRVRADDFDDLVAADVNGDGMPDLVAAAESAPIDRIAVLLNDRAGRFRHRTAYRTRGGAAALAVADVSRDGNVDIVAANWQHPGLSVLLGQGGGRFAPPRTFAGRSAEDIVVGDVNSDGVLDVVLERSEPSQISVRLGAGDGTFGRDQSIEMPSREPWSLTSSDLNRDGKLDLVVGYLDGRSVTVLLGNGDGTFAHAAPVPLGRNPDFALVADFNGDGNPDLAGDSNPGFAVVTGRGDG